MTDSVVSAAETDPDIQAYQEYLTRAHQVVTAFRNYLTVQMLWDSWQTVNGTVVWQYLDYLYTIQTEIAVIEEVLEILHHFFSRWTKMNPGQRNPCTGMKWASSVEMGQLIPSDGVDKWANARQAEGYTRPVYGSIRIAG